MIKIKKPALFLVLIFCTFNLFAADATVRGIYFHSEDCEDCQQIMYDFLPWIYEKYPSFELKEIDVETSEGLELWHKMEKIYEKDITHPPFIIVGDSLLLGKHKIEEKLVNTIELYLGQGGSDWSLPKTEIEDKDPVQTRFKELGLLTIIGAGLLDGVNPCAFSTIIIFVVYLSFVGRRRREILGVGLVFTAAVFIAYLSIGLGLLELMKRIQVLPTIEQIIIWIVTFAAIVLGVISISDYIKIKKGKLKEITLQLPDKIKHKIKYTIWKKQSKRYFLLSALLVGFFVGILEFPCTGQIYFPIVVVLKEVPTLKMNALFYLLLYNLMFIVPLLIIFSFVFFGIPSKKLTELLETHSGIVKLLTAFLFFVLAAILIFLNLR